MMSLIEAYPVEKASFFRNPNIGLYVFVNNYVAIVPPGIDPDLKRLLLDVLRVKKIIETKVSDISLIGVMIGGNDSGILLPRTIREEELNILKKEFEGNIEILKINANAIGNIILANSRAALVYKEIESETLKIIRETLDLEVVERGSLANILTIGSVGVVTNRGGIVHPDVSREELERLRELFRVPIDVGTVNFGIPFIRSGLLANDKGALVGSNTTGPEILRISKILGFGGVK